MLRDIVTRGNSIATFTRNSPEQRNINMSDFSFKGTSKTKI